ncbi:hypothetical protein HYH02_000133 [Chlamydomonas schloesseri]|uniref:PLAT domain-containing protein n=1 Tax=Chlamydomonas schloesseri TaxID=2026947 RepID=A0A835WLM5_9CHLO|nr:hypothetical protein HYH02_000133 [Chlamydomonas schloesseri]|eukprot:KAG2450029.1 hypothetical protein HYH02_000133 [Chlamydomonas schloesseri]
MAERQDWRSQLPSFLDNTESNIRSMRKDLPSSAGAQGRASRNPESVVNARAELSSLLAAVQGSLADLRVEVAAAKRLSTNASAAVAGETSPAPKGPVRSSSAQPRHRDQRPADVTPSLQMRLAAAAPLYPSGQPFGPLFNTPGSADVLLAGTPPAPTSASSAQTGQNEELVKAIDMRLLELGHKIERSLERSVEEQTLRSQLQTAMQAANVMQQQQAQQQLLRSSLHASGLTGFGSMVPVAPANGTPDGATVPTGAPAVAANGHSRHSTGGGFSPGAAAVAATASSNPLILLAMNKADAAEKISTEARSEVALLQKQAAKEAEDHGKHIASLEESSRHHWEKMCQVASQVDSLLAQRSGTAELQAEVARIAGRLVQMEGAQDRTGANMEEQQRLMRQLTTAMQKLTQDADSERAIAASRQGELAAKLEAAAARAGELEVRFARASDVEGRMTRLGDLEVKLARMGELEGRVSRVVDLEARVARLPDIEARIARLSDLEVKVARLGDLEGRLGRLADVEARLGRLTEVEAKLGRLSELEGRMARYGDVEAKLARLGELEARVARMGELEARLSRLSDAEARLAHVPELEARVAALQASVAAISAAAAVTPARASPAPPSPQPLHPPPPPPPAPPAVSADVVARTEEALQRLTNLEQQVARLAASGESASIQAQERDRERRRGQSQVAQVAQEAAKQEESVRSLDGIPPALAGWFGEALGSPASSVRAGGPGAASVNTSKRRDAHVTFSDRPLNLKDLDDRLRSLEEAMFNGNMPSPSPGPSSRSVQALNARMERLEHIVRAENSIEAMAQEARLAVTEEFVLELRRDFHDVVGPTLEKLAAHVSDLRKGQGQGSPDTGKVASEMRALNARLDSLSAEITSLSAHSRSAPPSAHPGAAPVSRSVSGAGEGAPADRLLVLEAQVKEISAAVEDTQSIFQRLQKHQTLLDKLQHEIGGMRTSVTEEMAALKERVDATDGQVLGINKDAREKLEQLARLDMELEAATNTVASLSERLGAQEGRVAELDRQQRAQREQLDMAHEQLEAQATQLVAAEERLGAHGEQLEAHAAQLVAAEEKLGAHGEQLEAHAAQLVAAEEKLGAHGEQLEAQAEQLAAAGKKLGVHGEQLEAQAEQLAAAEEKLLEQEEKLRDAAAAASSAAAGLAAAAAGGAAAAGAGAGAIMSRGLSIPAPEPSVSPRGFDGAADKAALAELEADLKGKLAELRSNMGDVRKELGSKVQVLDAQTQELLAFREEMLSSYMELQDGVDKATAVADEALRKTVEQEVQITELSQTVEAQAEAAAAAAAGEAKTRSSLAGGSSRRLSEAAAAAAGVNAEALEELQGSVRELQERVSAGATEQQERLEALDAKVHALSELITAASQDTQAASEARTRAEELAYELSQAQEALETLAADSGRLAEQLAAVAATSERNTGALQELGELVAAQGTAVERLQDGVEQLEGRVAAIKVAPLAAAATGAAVREAGHAEAPVVMSRGMPPMAAASAGGAAGGEAAGAQASRVGMTLPSGADKSMPGSQAILNPLFADSSEELDGLAPPATRAGQAVSIGAAAGGGEGSATTSGARAHSLESLGSPPLGGRPPLPEDSSVREKAIYYEQLASAQKTSEGGASAMMRRSNASSSAGAGGGSDGGGVSPLVSPRGHAAAPAARSRAAPPVSAVAETAEDEGDDDEVPFEEEAVEAADSDEEEDHELASPGAAAAVATGAVGIAGLRQAVAATGGTSRSLPPTPDGAAAAATSQEPIIATGGSLAAVRAARSGLGLSGDLSSPKFAGALSGGISERDEDDDEEGASPASHARRVFGREQTFRKGQADEEVSISSGDDEEQAQEEEEAALAEARQLGREQTFRHGGADEEVSLSSGDEGEEVEAEVALPDELDDDDDYAAGKRGSAAGPGVGMAAAGAAAAARTATAGLEASDSDIFEQEREDEEPEIEAGGVDIDNADDGNAGSGFDDDDELELAGMAPPPGRKADEDEDEEQELPVVASRAAPPPAAATATTARAAPAAPEASAAVAGDIEGGDDDDEAESVDVDEDIELEPGVNPGGFDYDDEDEMPTLSAPLPSQPPPPLAAARSGAVAASSEPVNAGASAIEGRTAPDAAAAAASGVEDEASRNASQLSTSGLGPLPGLSAGAAALLGASADSLSRRKLPPLAPLGPAGTSNLSTSRGLDLTPPLMRPPPLGASGNLSGNLSGHLSGDLTAVLKPPLGPVSGGGVPAASTTSTSAGGAPATTSALAAAAPVAAVAAGDSTRSIAAGDSKRSIGGGVSMSAEEPAPPVALAAPASMSMSGELTGRRMLAPLAPLAPLTRASGAGALPPVQPPPNLNISGGLSPGSSAAATPATSAGGAPAAAGTSASPPSRSAGGAGLATLPAVKSALPALRGVPPGAAAASAAKDADAESVASGFSGMSIGDLPDNGGAVGESAADPVSAELLAPAPMVIPGTGTAGAGCTAVPSMESLKKLVLHPTPQPHPLARGNESLPHPAEPATGTDASTASGSARNSDKSMPDTTDAEGEAEVGSEQVVLSRAARPALAAVGLEAPAASVRRSSSGVSRGSAATDRGQEAEEYEDDAIPEEDIAGEEEEEEEEEEGQEDDRGEGVSAENSGMASSGAGATRENSITNPDPAPMRLSASGQGPVLALQTPSKKGLASLLESGSQDEGEDDGDRPSSSAAAAAHAASAAAAMAPAVPSVQSRGALSARSSSGASSRDLPPHPPPPQLSSATASRRSLISEDGAGAADTIAAAASVGSRTPQSSISGALERSSPAAFKSPSARSTGLSELLQPPEASGQDATFFASPGPRAGHDDHSSAGSRTSSPSGGSPAGTTHDRSHFRRGPLAAALAAAATTTTITRERISAAEPGTEAEAQAESSDIFMEEEVVGAGAEAQQEEDDVFGGDHEEEPVIGPAAAAAAAEMAEADDSAGEHGRDSFDLDLPGMDEGGQEEEEGGAARRFDLNAGGSGSLGSLDVPPDLPGMDDGSAGDDGDEDIGRLNKEAEAAAVAVAAGTSSRSLLPPLPPGGRQSGAGAATSAAALAAGTSSSRMSLPGSEDSLALVAPAEGADRSLLSDGQGDDEEADIFAESGDADAMSGISIEASSGRFGSASASRAAPPAPLAAAAGAPGADGDASGASRRGSTPSGALHPDHSSGSVGFDGDVSMEAERVAALLSREPRAAGTRVSGSGSAAGQRSTDASGLVAVAESEAEEAAAVSEGGMEVEIEEELELEVAGDRAACSSGAGSGRPSSEGDAGRVHGSLDYYDEEDESSTSSSGIIAAGPTGAVAGAAGGLPAFTAAGTSMVYSDDSSMELEVFKPAGATAAAAAAAPASSLAAKGAGAGAGPGAGAGAGPSQARQQQAYAGDSLMMDDSRESIGLGGLGLGGRGDLYHGRSGLTEEDDEDMRAYEEEQVEAEPSRSSSLGVSAARAAAAAAAAPSVSGLSVGSDSAGAASASTPTSQRPPQLAAPSRQEAQRAAEARRPAVPALPFAHSMGDLSTSSGAYRVQVVTGDRSGSSCSPGAVRLTLYGSQAVHAAQLRPTAHAGRLLDEGERSEQDYFLTGGCDEFMVDTSADLGELTAIYIWHEGEGFSSSWFVSSVAVEQLMTGLEWVFEVNDWVRGGSRGGKVVRLDGAGTLSLSRENSLARLAGGGAGSRSSSPPRVSAPGRSSGGGAGAALAAPPGAGAGGAYQLRQRQGLGAFGDESMDVSDSDLNSPSEGPDLGGVSSRSFGGDELPGLGSAKPPRGGLPRGNSSGGGGSSSSAFAGASSAAAVAAGGGGRSGRMASNLPSGIGLVLEEDIEEVDGMLSTSAAFSLGPVSSRSTGPALVSPRPPLPPGAPRRRELTDEPSEGPDAATSGSGRRLSGSGALPPTPPVNRRSSGSAGVERSGSFGRRLSGGLEPEGSLDSYGSYGRRRVRVSGGGEEGDLASELSVEGSELSATSAASLSMYAPGGVRPPALAGGTVAVDFLGTSRKRVSWAEYADEYEFSRDDDSGSVASVTEEEMLESQGEATRPDSSGVGYDALLAKPRAGAGAAGAAAGIAGSGSASGSAAGGAGGDFMEVPLKRRKGPHANAYGYKIKVFTADKLNAGLGNTTVHVELLGRDATVSQALPKGKGSFARGCADRFTLYSHAGDMGQLLALKIWHEGKTLGPGNWGFESVVIDDRLKGNRYTFHNPNPECVLRKGRRHCLVLKPAVTRIDESEDLAEVAREYETQLAANRGLNEQERAGLRGKLDKINQRLSRLGARVARTLSGGSRK